MPRKRTRPRQTQPATITPTAVTEPSVIDRIMDIEESSLLDVLDHVLTKGVMATGDLTLGIAGIDLIYIRLSALLCAADRVLPASAVKRHDAARRNTGRPRRRAS
jgi:gas vesicle structural protein